MQAIVLSCGTGGGHNSAAEAIADAIRRAGGQAEQVDFLKLCGPMWDAALGQSYVGVVKIAPKLFGAVYGLGEQISSYDRHSPIYACNAMLSGALEAYLGEHEADALICTHLYPAEAATYLRDKGRLAQKTIAVATDYTCIPFWEETRCDWYISPHKDCLPEYARRGMGTGNILSYGIPVREPFAKRRDRGECRRALGLESAGRVFLVMGGSMGFGQIPALVNALYQGARLDDALVVLCGNDKKLYDQLSERYSGVERLRVIGFTKDVASYMAAGDVLFTKPGGLSSTEAAVAGIPIVHTEPIPGCETENLSFFVRHGMSVTANGARDLAETGLALANSPERMAKMRECQAKNTRPDAADQIAALARKICE